LEEADWVGGKSLPNARRCDRKNLESIVGLKKLIAAFVVVFSIFVAAPKSASAATIGFSCVTEPAHPGTCSNLNGFFSGELTLTNGGLTLTAVISNSGAGSITDIFVDAPLDGAGYNLSGIFIENPDAGVTYTLTGAPPDLPGAAGFDADFDAHASNPNNVANGVSTSESVGLVFTLTTALTDAGLNALLADGSLRFGLHVQSITEENGVSESFVSNYTPPCPAGQECPSDRSITPEPASMLLLGTGLLVVARARRKKTV
jgi:PEP-CTERM motif